MRSIIQEIVDTIEVDSPNTYFYKDRYYAEKSKNDNIFTTYQKLDLSELVYRIYHCRFRNLEHMQTDSSSIDSRNFELELSANNMGKGTWEGGWKITRIEKSTLVASKNGLCLWAPQSMFRIPNGGKCRIGRYGYIWMPKECFRLLQGFYYVKGEMAYKPDPNQIIVRVYWNVQSKAASLLVKEITTNLNAKIPYHFKILNDPVNFFRSDSAVLYFRKDHFSRIRCDLRTIYSKLQKYMNFETSYFTKKLAPGLSIAESPADGDSFGKNRSKIIAEGLYEARRKNIITGQEKVHEIFKVFSKYDLNLDYPYLNPSSVDIYEFQ